MKLTLEQMQTALRIYWQPQKPSLCEVARQTGLPFGVLRRELQHLATK